MKQNQSNNPLIYDFKANLGGAWRFNFKANLWHKHKLQILKKIMVDFNFALICLQTTYSSDNKSIVVFYILILWEIYKPRK